MLIAVTLGDACGVGPEIILKAYSQNELKGDFIVIGDVSVIEYCNEIMEFGVPVNKIEYINEAKNGFLNVLDLGLLRAEDLSIGKVCRQAGYAAKKYVEYATSLALRNEVDAIVTLPMNKEATRLSDETFSGHTELIAQMCGETDYTMMLASDRLVVTHVSTHVSMREAVNRVKSERIYKVVQLTYDAMRKIHSHPRIAVAGLNPHAGENGSFGLEEIEEIRPAIEQARKDGIDAIGPVAPDTVFYRAVEDQYDAVVCMYHDQGHIPMKVLDFEGGVNVTLGLKVIRTSVDHGTAFDIAYKGVASTKSLVLAFAFAKRLAQSRLLQ